MNIFLAVLALFFFVVSFSIFVDSITSKETSFKNELASFISMTVLFIVFISMYIALYYFTKYEVEIELETESSYFSDVSTIIEGDIRTTIEERKPARCKVYYYFDRELILFDKSAIKVYYEKSCDMLTEQDKTEIETRRLNYVRELNERRN